MQQTPENMTAEEKEQLAAGYISAGFTTMETLYQTMPFCMDYETNEHKKERYNQIQAVFKEAAKAAEQMDIEKDQQEIGFYMMALADCCDTIDEEVFDHYKNLELAFKKVLHRLVPAAADLNSRTRLMAAYAVLKACRIQMILEEKYRPFGMEQLSLGEEAKEENPDLYRMAAKEAAL